MGRTGKPSAAPAARRIDIPALAGGAAQERLLDADGRIIEPLLLVDLDAPATQAAFHEAVSASRAADRVLVGVIHNAPDSAIRELVEALDLTLATPQAVAGLPFASAGDPDDAAASLHAAAVANPDAAVMLGRVLRTNSKLDVSDALDVESTAYSTLLGGREFAQWLGARGRRPLPPPAEQPPVQLDRDGDQLWITLDRPERRNAFGRELRDGLVDALRLAELDEGIKQVVLTGAGPSFCSGGDLDEFGTTADLARAHFVRTRGGAARLLHHLGVRCECRVHGSCVGAGIELPAFASRVLADPDTTFRLPEVSMGLIPGAGGTVSVPRRIGRWRTLYMALSGTPVDASTALSWGLVDAIG